MFSSLSRSSLLRSNKIDPGSDDASENLRELRVSTKLSELTLFSDGLLNNDGCGISSGLGGRGGPRLSEAERANAEPDRVNG